VKLVAVAAAAAGVASGAGFVNDEAHDLALFDVVECNHANVAIAIFRAALLHFV